MFNPSSSAQARQYRLGVAWGRSVARNFSIDRNASPKVSLIQAPEGVFCPIANEPAQDPVVTADGSLYERECIHQWIEERRRQGLPITSPSTGVVLEETMLTPVLALTQAIETYVAQHYSELKDTVMRDVEDMLNLQQAKRQSAEDNLVRMSSRVKELQADNCCKAEKIEQYKLDYVCMSKKVELLESLLKSAQSESVTWRAKFEKLSQSWVANEAEQVKQYKLDHEASSQKVELLESCLKASQSESDTWRSKFENLSQRRVADEDEQLKKRKLELEDKCKKVELLESCLKATESESDTWRAKFEHLSLRSVADEVEREKLSEKVKQLEAEFQSAKLANQLEVSQLTSRLVSSQLEAESEQEKMSLQIRQLQTDLQLARSKLQSKISFSVPIAVPVEVMVPLPVEVPVEVMKAKS